MRDALCQVLTGRHDLVDRPAFSPADWDLLVTTARTDGVAPLLYHTLNEAGWPEQMPANLRRDLRGVYFATTVRNALLYRELSRILTALHDTLASESENGAVDGLPAVVVLKGAALASTLYSNIGLRPMDDLDLLVPEDQFEQAVAAVLELGYTHAPGSPEISASLTRLISYEMNFEGGEGISVHLDLHWNLISGQDSRYRPRIDWFWEQTEPWKMESGKWTGERGKGKGESGKEKTEERQKGTPSLRLRSGQASNLHPFDQAQDRFPSSILQLTPTAHLLYLAAHLALEHGEAHSPLRWFYDIHLLVTREGHRIDWDELILRAREFRWSAALHAALRGAQDRFVTPLPDDFLETLAKVQDPQAARLVKRKTTVQTRAARTWDSLMSLSWPARLRLAWALAFPSPDYMRWRYNPRPAWLWLLWYPYRWFDILREGLSTLWRIGKGKGEQGNKETRG